MSYGIFGYFTGKFASRQVVLKGIVDLLFVPDQVDRDEIFRGHECHEWYPRGLGSPRSDGISVSDHRTGSMIL